MGLSPGPVQAIVDAAVGELSGTVTTKGNPDGPQAAVSPGAVPAGGDVFVQLSEYPAGSVVDVVLHRTELGKITVGDDGTAAARVAVPADIKPKKYNLWTVTSAD